MKRKLKNNKIKPILISICSGKGGVGKSVIASNLAAVLSRTHKTLLWDGDIYFPNQHLMLGLEPPVRFYDVYSNGVPVERAIYEVKNNFYLLADAPATGKFDLLKTVDLQSIYNEIANSLEFNFIILDTAAGGTYEVLQSAIISDLILIVITDEPTSLLDAYALVKLFLPFINSDKIKLVVNNVIDIDDAIDVSHKLNLATDKFLDMHLDYIGYIPYSRLVRLSIIQQKLLVEHLPNEEVSIAISNIANKIVNEFENKHVSQAVNNK